MNISFIIKSLILALTVFFILFAISFISSQKVMVDSNNYGVRDSMKESINIAKYRATGEITFDEETLIKSTIKNYIKNNNINVDDITFEIALDEENDIVTVSIYTEKELFNSDSKANYTFSYQIIER